MPSVIIIGGGISGLAAAYFLEQRARERGLMLGITLLEKSRRTGGVIQSEHIDLTETKQRFLCEAGPDSLLTTKPAAIELCRKLGMGDQLIPSNDGLRKTYVLHGGSLRSLPDGLMFVVPTKVGPMFSSDLLSLAGKLRLLLSPMFSPGALPDEQDVSVDQYITQRFGQEVSDRLAEPLLNAVYGADARAMSARAVFPQLLALEKQYGSLWKAFAVKRAQQASAASGKTGAASPAASTIFVTLRDGMEQLPIRLRAALQTTRVVEEEAAVRVSRSAGRGGFQVITDRGERSSDAVILAVPAPVAANLLAPLDTALSGQLGAIVYHSVAIAALGYHNLPAASRAGDWGKRGFGFVVPRGERREMIACTWMHNKFNHRVPPGAALLRAFFGGARNEEIDRQSEVAVAAMAQRELAEIMGLQAAPDFHHVYRWPRSMPQYSVGHPDLLSKIDHRLAVLPGLQLAGNAYRGVGIPDCVQSGAEAARRTCDALLMP